MRAVKAVGWSMITVGSLILLFLAYQLLFTNLITARAQNVAAGELQERFATMRESLPEPETIEVVPPGTVPPSGDVDPEIPQPDTETRNEVVLYSEPAPAVGEEFGRIIVPSLGLDKVIFEGVDRETLKNGPGHMPWTPLPGQPGNAVLSGHRTTYGAPFFNFDELGPGDEVIVETVLGSHVYEVRESIIVQPSDVWVTEARPGAWLTLTTCHPRFSASQRLVIFAELVDGPNHAYSKAAKDGLIDLVDA